MTPHQAVCHLADGFRFVLGDRRVTSQPQFLGPIVRTIALRLPLPWPRGVKTMPEVDQEIGGTRPQEFERDRAELLTLIDRFAARADEAHWPDHPMFGRMRRDVWGRWGHRHLDHHLRQFGH